MFFRRICFRDPIRHPPMIWPSTGMSHGSEFEPDTSWNSCVWHFDRGDTPGLAASAGDSGKAERLFRREAERHSGMIPNTIGA
jgi:hypothetical protein